MRSCFDGRVGVSLGCLRLVDVGRMGRFVGGGWREVGLKFRVLVLVIFYFSYGSRGIFSSSPSRHGTGRVNRLEGRLMGTPCN